MARNKNAAPVEDQTEATEAEEQGSDEAQTEITPEGLEVSTFSINSDKVATHPKAYNGRTFRFLRLGPVAGGDTEDGWADVMRQARLVFKTPTALRDAINGQGVDLTNQKRIKDEGNAEEPTGADALQEALMQTPWIEKASRKRGSTQRTRQKNAAEVVQAAMQNPDLAALLQEQARKLGITL